MGYSDYSVSSRSFRSTSSGLYSKSIDEIFTQSVEKKIHESMSPKGVNKRECFDSENHPNTIPIILTLDVTGSMGKIPHELVKDGLPTLMGSLIQNGVEDASLLFLAVGDHEHDRFPLQVGQFESGDEELDLWLTRTYLEGGGGGNAGESYLLSWYFAANHTDIDSFNKRNKKGFLFTIGDEPCLKTLPSNVVKEIMGNNPLKSFTDYELLEQAQAKYNVYHLHVVHGPKSEKALSYWKELMGDNCVEVRDYKTLSRVVSDIILNHKDISFSTDAPTSNSTYISNSENML
jgi:hypothetical protein